MLTPGKLSPPKAVRLYCEPLKLPKAGIVPSSSRWKQAIRITLVWFPLANSSSCETTRPCAVPSLASLNCGEALDATTEFITLNERLCSRPHSITHQPDDKLHRLPWLPDPKGCLINQRLDMATISWGNSGQGCPGHVLTPTLHYLALFSSLTLAATCECIEFRASWEWERERVTSPQPHEGCYPRYPLFKCKTTSDLNQVWIWII